MVYFFVCLVHLNQEMHEQNPSIYIVYLGDLNFLIVKFDIYNFLRRNKIPSCVLTAS